MKNTDCTVIDYDNVLLGHQNNHRIHNTNLNFKIKSINILEINHSFDTAFYAQSKSAINCYLRSMIFSFCNYLCK